MLDDPADESRYRANVGIVVANQHRQVLAGESFHYAGEWMMPQGGIDAGETPVQAMRRELYEETAIDLSQTRLLEEHGEWHCYRLRHPLVKHGKVYAGQRQKWFLLSYDGALPDATATPDREFRCFAWVDPNWLIKRAASYKIHVYQEVFAAFADYFPAVIARK